MSFNSALYHYLSSNAAIASLVGTRIYPQRAESGAARPYITYAKIGNDHVHHQGGAAGLTSAMRQLDVWADSALSAESVYDALRTALDGMSGTMGTGAYETTVESILIVDDDEGFEKPTDGSQQATYRHRVDITIWHRETVPTF